MNVIRDELLENTLLDELMAEMEDGERQHPSVTDLIYCMTAKFYNMQLGDKKPEVTRKMKLFFTIGIGVEKVLLVKRKMTPIAGEHEGIYYHVDSLDGFNTKLMEVKTTRKPVKGFEATASDGWLKQVMAYCKATGETSVEFAIVHLIQAELQCYRVEFTQQEIDDNWEWLQGRKKVWNEALATGGYPQEYLYNEPWECKECVFAAICEMRSRVRAN